MLVSGDLIKMVKPVPGFDDIGETFKVLEILENGMIRFETYQKAGIGARVGLMSFGEFEKYFEKIPKRDEQQNWTDWISQNGYNEWNE